MLQQKTLCQSQAWSAICFYDNYNAAKLSTNSQNDSIFLNSSILHWMPQERNVFVRFVAESSAISVRHFWICTAWTQWDCAIGCIDSPSACRLLEPLRIISFWLWVRCFPVILLDGWIVVVKDEVKFFWCAVQNMMLHVMWNDSRVVEVESQIKRNFKFE